MARGLLGESGRDHDLVPRSAIPFTSVACATKRLKVLWICDSAPYYGDDVVYFELCSVSLHSSTSLSRQLGE